jgi:hypothetical protein
LSRKLALLLLAVAACGDPVRDNQVAALGDEAPGVEPGPLHRPGQPCVACHSNGEAEVDFSLAGTVFQRPTDDAPLAGATIRVIDSSGLQTSTVSNCVGNFFFKSSDFAPRWPVWVKLELGETTVEMSSAISREGSCAACHAQPASPSSPGQLYFASDKRTFPEVACDD